MTTFEVFHVVLQFTVKAEHEPPRAVDMLVLTLWS